MVFGTAESANNRVSQIEVAMEEPNVAVTGEVADHIANEVVDVL
jgi:hypothetical protein